MLYGPSVPNALIVSESKTKRDMNIKRTQCYEFTVKFRMGELERHKKEGAIICLVYRMTKSSHTSHRNTHMEPFGHKRINNPGLDCSYLT